MLFDDLEVCIVEVIEVGCILIFVLVCCDGSLWFVLLSFE